MQRQGEWALCAKSQYVKFKIDITESIKVILN